MRTHTIPTLMLVAVMVAAGGCREAELSDAWSRDEASSAKDGPAVAEDGAGAPPDWQEELAEVEVSLAEAEAEAEVARQELAELRERMAEQEREAGAREAKLESALALEKKRAEVESAERQLKDRARELEERERLLEAREFDVTVREDAIEEAGSGDLEALAADREVGWVEEEREDDAAPAGQPRTTKASLEPGKMLEVEVLETLSSRTHRVGDTFEARLVQDLRNEAGVLVIPAGARIQGEVVHVVPLKKVGGQAELGIEFTHIEVSPGETVRIRASLVELGENKRKDKKKILIATAAGAILGRVLGGDAEGAVAGAAVGAAASTAVAASAKDKDAEIPAGEKIALQLEEVVTVEVQMTGTAESWRP
jgi:hypothetical protein